MAIFHKMKSWCLHLKTTKIFTCQLLQKSLIQLSPQTNKGAGKAIGLVMVCHLRLSTQIGVSRQEAQTFMDIYFKRYPGVKDFMAETRQLAHEQVMCNHIRKKITGAGINDRNFNRRQAAERAAINAPMQGSAADIIKKAMIDLIDYPYKMVLQVHDELIFEVPEAVIFEATKQIKESMEKAVSLTVPLSVNIAHAKNWLDAIVKNFKFEKDLIKLQME